MAETDSVGLDDPTGIVFANEALLDFHRNLIYKGVQASQIQESYRDIKGGVGTYLFPTDMFFLKAVEINFTDQSANNYLPGDQVDSSNLPNGTSFSWLRNNQSSGSLLIDVRGDWFELFPTPASDNSQGIRILYYLGPTEFISVTDTVPYPDSLDYRCIGWRIAANYKRSLLDFASADKFEEEYQKHLSQIENTLARGSQQPTRASPIRDSGWGY